MSAISLTPFIAPAAGTIAFLLLLCVSIGAVLALTPFRANEKMVTEGIDEELGAGAVSLAASHGGMSIEVDVTATRPIAKQTSSSQAEGFQREADSLERTFGTASVESGRDVLMDPSHASEQSPHWAPADRWWGINE